MKEENRSIFTLQDAGRRIGPVVFNTLVKPYGSTCNLDCTYCYYLDKALQYGGREPLMDYKLLEQYIRQHIESVDSDQVDFCWHGGEPLLCGLDYFRKIVSIQDRFKGDKKISNSLQTNGTLLTDEWCRFFAGHDFLIGLSLDGPRDIHDAFRVNKGGKPTFDKVMNAVTMLKRNHVEFNTLSVVSSLCEGRGTEIYRFFRDCIGSRYMQFLPAVEHTIVKPGIKRPVIVPPEYPGSEPAEWSVSSLGYGQFLCDIFDEWVRNDVGRTFVIIFDATLSLYCGLQPGYCAFAETCGDSLSIEHNGDVYPCDHFVYPDYKLGNLRETPLGAMFDSDKHLRFSLAKRNTLPDGCLRCKWFFACHGECPKHRFGEKNALCDGLKLYFSHTEKAMKRMKELLDDHQSPSNIMLDGTLG